jgi:hypothetical protein
MSVERAQRRLGDRHVRAVVAAADTDPADELIADHELVAAAENDEPVDPRGRAIGLATVRASTGSPAPHRPVIARQMRWWRSR